MAGLLRRKTRALDSDPIDVCIVSRWFYPTLIGPGERFRRYAPGLRTRGIHLRVITTQQPGISPFETVDGIPVQRFPVDVKLDRMSTVLLQKGLSSFGHTGRWPDVVQLLSHSHRNVPHVWNARLRGIPFLFVSTMIKSEPKDVQGVLRRLKGAISRRLYFGPLNCLVTSSSVMAQCLVGLGASSKHVEIIPNGVDVRRFRPAQSREEWSETRRQLGIELGDEVILFVGMISHRKGIDALVAAWPEIARRRPRARLLLVGHRVDADNLAIPPSFRDPAFMDKVDRILAHSPSPERVVFAGSVSNVEAYMRVADLFVFPSRHEGMPNVVPEAMASGLPCIVSPFDGLPSEFGDPGRDYVLVAREPGALATAITEMLDNEDARQAIGDSARRWVERELNVEMSLDRFAQLYRRLARENWYSKTGKAK